MRKSLPALALLMCVALSPLGFTLPWLLTEGYVRPYAEASGGTPTFAPSEPTYTASAYFNGSLLTHPREDFGYGCSVLVDYAEPAPQELASAVSSTARGLQIVRALAWLVAYYLVALRLGLKRTVLYTLLSSIAVIVMLTLFGPLIGCVGFSSTLVSGGYSDVYYVVWLRPAVQGPLFALATLVLPVAALWWTRSHPDKPSLPDPEPTHT